MEKMTLAGFSQRGSQLFKIVVVPFDIDTLLCFVFSIKYRLHICDQS